jgi:hypothetical protein
MRAVGPLVAAISVVTASLPVGGGRTAIEQGPSDKAAAVMADARSAIGGDARIAAVKTFVVTGRTRQIRGNNLVPIEFEIQVELPDKYARRDEFPAQDNGPSTIGFNGDTLVQRSTPSPSRGGGPAAGPEQQAAAARARLATVKQDFARLMIGMFASSFRSFPLAFTYVGQAEAPQGKADVVDVTGPADFRVRLFISGETHLPIMLSWQAAPPAGRRGGPPPAGGPSAASQPVEQRMYFADYREVDGLKLPFRIRGGAGTETTEETTFDRFRINVPIDARRFQSGD